jgi:cell fate (sporulation/competence/biofilm development) regulator YmcA (YheA/YmcA/DUF963 family)
MGIFELAAELGKVLKEDERLVKLEQARKAYEQDERIGKLMMEYEVQQRAIQNEAVKEDRDQNMLAMIEQRIQAIYEQITQSEVYKALEAAQEEVNELMNKVNSTITYNITGELPSACTHDCSSCGGCH